MWKKLGRLIINNFGLKVLGVILAIVIWLAIVNTEDAEKAATFTVPVEIVNADYLLDQGKTFEIPDNSDTISFTVNGKRSIVENLTADDFRAVANMENIDDSMSMVPITLTATRYSSQLDITRMASYLMVEVENLITQDFEIEVAVEGTPADDYFVYEATSSPDVVSVTGPESLVDEIETAQTLINVSDEEETFTSTGSVLLMTETGFLSDAEERLTLDVDQTDVTATIYMRKKVPITFEVTGEPAEGYWYTDPECDIDTLIIEGDPDVVSDIEDITCDSSKLSVEGASEDVIVQIKLDDLLPDGVTLEENQPEEVTVTIPVVEAETEEVEVPSENITVSNLPENMTLNISTDTVTVQLTGLRQALASVVAEGLSGTIDASDLEAGSYDLTVLFETDGSYKAEAEVPVTVTQTDSTGS